RIFLHYTIAARKCSQKNAFFPGTDAGARNSWEGPGTLSTAYREGEPGERCPHAGITDARAKRCGHLLLTRGMVPLELPALRVRKEREKGSRLQEEYGCRSSIS